MAALRRRRRNAGATRRYDAAFRLMYERFREILNLNDTTLELIADIEDRLSRDRPFAPAAMERRIRQAAMDVFVMVKNLNQLANGGYPGLYDVLRHLDLDLERELAPPVSLVGPLVIPLPALRAADAALAGTKMATLGEVAGLLDLRVPRGFAISTVAVARFLTGSGLWERCEGLDDILDSDAHPALAPACTRLRSDIVAAALPEELEHALGEATRTIFGGGGARLAVRSSAVGEDSASSSHAGIYETVLDVAASGLGAAYRAVVASAFTPTAVTYRFERGLSIRESLMAVGCIEMVAPRCAGILYSRPPDDREADVVLISATAGVAAGVAAGERSAEVAMVVPGDEDRAPLSLLAAAETAELVAAARSLERHFGAAQDVEWAVDGEGRVWVLQSRPLAAPVAGRAEAVDTALEGETVLAGGFGVFPGVAAGPVVQVRDGDDLAGFPAGGVLVARHSSPSFASVMARCAAIVTDVGSPTGHMASLAREFEVPAIVGMAGAVATLEPGRHVTVDAGRCRVLSGSLVPAEASRPRVPKRDSPALGRLRRISQLVTPLALTDPTSTSFSPEACRSLHDITRFVHEKAYGVMFHYGNVASEDRHHSFRLDARLPIVIRVFDVGGGITEAKVPGGRVRPGEITSAPMRSLLAGMLEPRIRWDLPRPVSVRGFLSVLGESMAGPPAETLQIGRLSYAIVSDRYLNFSTKAGYHFQTVDAYCGESQNKNYVHFRFHGGAADAQRRARRVRFLSAVLTALDFTVTTRGDLLTARFDKYPAEVIAAKLVDLGHLTLCARQLDMLMDSDARPEYFAQAFLTAEWEKF